MSSSLTEVATEMTTDSILAPNVKQDVGSRVRAKTCYLLLNSSYICNVFESLFLYFFVQARASLHQCEGRAKMSRTSTFTTRHQTTVSSSCMAVVVATKTVSTQKQNVSENAEVSVSIFRLFKTNFKGEFLGFSSLRHSISS